MKSLAIALLAGLLGTAAAAQDITLTSQDGAIALSGSLIGFDGEFYRIDSDFGALTVSAEGVTCDGPGCPDLEAYVAEAHFAGAGAIADSLLPALIEAFALDRALAVTREIGAGGAQTFLLARSDGSVAARFRVSSGTTEDGFLALLNREADMALALREPSALEQLAARAAAGDGAAEALARRARIIGLDALVAITSRSHPLRRIAPEDLVRLYSGEIANWADLGGVDAPVALHLPASSSGLAQAVMATLFADPGATLAADVVRHDDLRDLADAVARDPFAIGITAYSALGNARDLALSGACGFAVRAAPESLKTGDYPFTAPLFVYTPPHRLPRLVRDFLGFFETPAAERVVRRAGYVSQTITESGIDDQGRRLANAILAAGDDVALADLQVLAAHMDGAARLSPTFRFAGGTSTLGAQSQSAMSRLARAIEQGDYDGRTLLFVGFSDGAGSAGANLRLSRSRAETVRRAVMEAAGAADLNRLGLRTAAFGEALPIACDESPWGAATNRRVEVWLQ